MLMVMRSPLAEALTNIILNVTVLNVETGPSAASLKRRAEKLTFGRERWPGLGQAESLFRR